MSLPVTLRAAVDADQPLLLCVYAGTRAAELALTCWDAAACQAFVRMQFDAQSSHYRRHWPASEHSVIEVVAAATVQAVGRLWLDRRADSLHVLDIALLPEWCGRGIGTHCLRQLIAEASQTARSVTIHVEQGNSARRLYDRLGFRPSGEPQGLHQPMAWRPDAAALSTTKEAVCHEQA